MKFIYKKISLFRNLPCGVQSLHPAFSNDKDGDDKLYSVTQRYGYQESPSKELPTQKRQVRLPARYKNAKMSVRLRPRQVLCSKCRGICNENSENVDNSRKRKIEETNIRQQPKRVITGMQTRNSKPLLSDSQNNEQQRSCISLRIPQSLPEENGHSTDDDEEDEEEEEEKPKPPPQKISKAKNMVLRKKHSVGSMEDLWDESVFEENNLGELQNTRTIKISFGREGEGTILKIPAKIDDLMDSEKEKDKTSAKAARRALKKAKKEARRKILLGSGGSPCYTLGGNSPRYAALAGNASPRIGGASPRYNLTPSTAGYENLVPRRHKHKVCIF